MRKRKPRRTGCSLPGRFIRTRSGSYARVLKTTKRSARNEALVRLEWIEGSHRVRSSFLWTVRDLTEGGVRWLKRAPSCYKEAC